MNIDRMNIDKIIADHYGGMLHVRMNPTKWEDIAVGKRFWCYTKTFLSNNELNGSLDPEMWRLMTITYIRSGVVFYRIEEQEQEEHFEQGSAMVSLIEPQTYVHNNDPQYYKMISRSGKVDFQYQPA